MAVAEQIAVDSWPEGRVSRGFPKFFRNSLPAAWRCPTTDPSILSEEHAIRVIDFRISIQSNGTSAKWDAPIDFVQSADSASKSIHVLIVMIAISPQTGTVADVSLDLNPQAVGGEGLFVVEEVQQVSDYLKVMTIQNGQ